MNGRRRAAVAGRWYPDDRVQLADRLDDHLGRAEVESLPAPVVAIVAPHAGLMYSGPVAAYAYQAVRHTAYRAIILVGPSHFVPFDGVSVWPAGEWDTPLGPVPVDSELAESLARESLDVVEMPEAHGREHSLEMQLPFIARLLPGVPIVPVAMGHQIRQTAFSFGGAMARAVRSRAASSGPQDSSTLLVASSDLSHYEDARVAARLDASVIGLVEALDPEGLMDALEREPRHACGGGPLVAVLHAARQLGARSARLLRYADSGDVSGDKSSVVGYMAAAVW